MRHTRNPIAAAALAGAAAFSVLAAAQAPPAVPRVAAVPAVPATPVAAAAPAAASPVDVEVRLEQARQRLDTAAREVAELSMQSDGGPGTRFVFAGEPPRRAILGVQVDPASGRDGARIAQLSPVAFAAAPFQVALPPPGGVASPDWPGEGPSVTGLELATVTPTLGRYFGTDKGVLVLRAPRQDAWKLQEGDVILAIDGREPRSGAHASRILRTYQPGENLKLRVMRDRQALELAVAVPESGRIAGRHVQVIRTPDGHDMPPPPEGAAAPRRPPRPQ